MRAAAAPPTLERPFADPHHGTFPEAVMELRSAAILVGISIGRRDPIWEIDEHVKKTNRAHLKVKELYREATWQGITKR